MVGQYWVQTLIDSTLFDEVALLVADAEGIQTSDEVSERVN